MSNRRTAARTATMTAPASTRTAVRRATVDAADDATRTLEVCVVPWNETARVTDDGRTFYDETWAPGSLEAAELVPVYDGHRPTAAGVERGEVIGRADPAAGPDDTGYRAVLRLADSSRGRDVYAVARTLGVVYVSLEADITPPVDGVALRTAEAPCRLTGVSVVLPPAVPAFSGAVGAARSSPEPEPDDPEPDDPEPDDTATRARVLELVRTEVARYAVRGSSSGAAPHPLERYGSFDELHAAARSLPAAEAGALSRAFSESYAAHRTAARAWTNQLSSLNPGVMPPSWLTEVFGIVDRGRPAITALGGPRGAGDSGLDVHWPYFDGDLTTIVGKQTAEKTEITSVVVALKRGTATLATYAGGSDVSYQLQRRSSPSYMATYDRILQIAFGITTDDAFVDALIAAAGSSMVFPPLTSDADDWRAFLFGASAKVRGATGAPATAVLVASDVFAYLGGLGGLVAPTYGTQNVPGTAQASTLRINVNGLEITEVPMAPAGTVLVTNDEAARWLEEGPFLATAEDVHKLGTDVAIWGMGVTAPVLPGGIVKTTLVAGRSSSK